MAIRNMKNFVRNAVSKKLGGRPDQERNENGQFSYEGATKVGITSARPGTPDAKVKADMETFKSNMSKLKGVTNLKVQMGTGGWQGGSELTWVTSYDGNGEALKEIAKVGIQYDQDAIIFMKATPNGKDPVTQFTFDHAIGNEARVNIEESLAKNNVGGWTWYDDGGKAVLRVASIPDYGGDTDSHMAQMGEVEKELSSKSFKSSKNVEYRENTIWKRGEYEQHL